MGSSPAVAEMAVAKANGETSLVRTNSLDGAADERWKRVAGLECVLTVDLPMPHFKVGDLLKLRPGSVVDARWKVGRDVPLLLNATKIGWVEFEAVGQHLAVRLTELA